MSDTPKTLSPSGAAPESRVESAEETHTMVQALIREDAPRARKRAMVQGQIDGNPPYDAEELRRLGQSHRTNLNTREAKGNHNARRTTYYELVMEVPCLVDVSVDGDQPVLDHGQTIAEEMHNILWKWDGFLYNMMLHHDQIISFGAGPILFPDDIDWRFEAVEMGAVRVPRNSKASTADLDCCAITFEYPAHELYRRIETPEAANRSELQGWKPAVIKQAIIDAAARGTGSTLSDWEKIQQTIKHSDLTAGYVHMHPVYAAHFLYREFNGKISHAIVLDCADKTKNQDFLFRKVGRYASWQNALHLVLSEIGTNGKYHSVRGLDQETFAHSTLNDRLTSQIVDAAITSGTIVVQPGAAGTDSSKFRMARVGPFTVVPAGLEIVKTDFNPQMQGLVQVLNLMRANLAGFAGLQSAMPDEEQRAGRASLGVEKLRLSKEGQLERGLISFYYHQLDALYLEVARRLLNPRYTQFDAGYELRQEFIDRCIARGVPEDLLKIDKLHVTAMRSLGYGSPTMRRIDTDWLTGMTPHMDEIGRNNTFRDAAASRVGYRQVDRYFPKYDRNRIPTSEHSLAALENNDLREGQPVVVGVDQPHVIHLAIHTAPLRQMAENYLAGRIEMELQDLLRYFDAGLQHSAQHLDYLRGDRSREIDYGQYMQLFQELVRVYNRIGGDARAESQRKQTQAAAQQKALQDAMSREKDEKILLQLRELEGELALKQTKENNIQGIREQKAASTIAIAQRMAQLREDLARRQAAAKETVQ